MKRDWIFSSCEAIKYLWKGKTNLYIHSPFVYDFCINVRDLPPASEAMDVRRFFDDLARENMPVTWDHPLGGVSHSSMSKLIRRSSMSPPYGFLLNHLVKHYKAKRILELGTHLGVGSSYLYAGNQLDSLITLEGSARLTELAFSHFNRQGFSEIQQVNGLFEVILPNILRANSSFDLIFFDGHHDGDATYSYFLQCLPFRHSGSVFVFDDIHWSRDMHEAWKKICQHESVRISIDLYRMGIVFFREEKLRSEHFCLRYGWHF